MVHVLLTNGDKQACIKLANALVHQYPKFKFKPYAGRASGYIIDTMQTVFHCFFSTHSFEECLIQTVNFGEDADTTGAIVGMLAGALYGVDAIPKRWLKKLDKDVKSEIEMQTQQLLKSAKNGDNHDHNQLL
jgi:ADP-ribosyl-[dinitrogen reductase] hydrolase